MQKDFHYYLIYSLLMDCDYPEADTAVIAYASQYVDDCNEHQVVRNVPFNNRVHVGDHHYFGIITQTFSLKTFTDEIQRYVLMPFHFIPGNNPAVNFNGRTNRYATMPATHSPIADELFTEALDSAHNYQLGAILHSIVDTFSHENFSGMEEDWNTVYPWYSPYSVAPNIGHAEVGQQPDTISDMWYDKRLPRSQQKIINKDRAMAGVEYVFRKLHAHKHPDTNIDDAWASIKQTYSLLVCGPDQEENNYDYDQRIDAVRKHLNRPDLNYDRQQWLEEAVKYNEKEQRFEAVSPETFIHSHYWQFQIAARKQISAIWERLSRYLL